MIELPLLERLEVKKFGLYPGEDRNGQFNINFGSGLTVVLGANGLGKSTLVNILFRMMTGPWDISLPEGQIGTSQIKAQELSAKRRSTFSARVNDTARDATATLTFSIGPTRFKVSRSLAKLSLIGFAINDEPERTNEEYLQNALLSASNIGTFGEWIFLLRTMVFFFEDRRMLVWDTSAQRQLLRCMFLSQSEAREWIRAERDILELDTRMRNLKAVLGREENEKRKNENLSKAAPEVRAELKATETLYRAAKDKQEKLTDLINSLDENRRRFRLDSLRANDAFHTAKHELERARLLAVEARFPSADESMRYIFSRLMTDDLCIVCQTPGRVEKRTELLQAIDARHCVLCNAEVGGEAGPLIDITEARLITLRRRVDEASITAKESRENLDASTLEYERANQSILDLDAEIAELKSDIEVLERSLPPEDQAARKQNDSLAELQKTVIQLRAEIQAKREAFASQMNSYRHKVATFAERVKDAFDITAKGFLLEAAKLTWAPVRMQVGQAGTDGASFAPTEYPAFCVDMTGASFSTPVRRDSPEQVSESQREFIDLAFRMALIQVASQTQTATIIIDAPESSLDAVFVTRAANTLASFANRNTTNRLIITSNLAAGKLIPAILKASEPVPEKRLGRVVDLFKIGVPTRAMSFLEADYNELRNELFADIAGTPQDAGAR